MTQHNIKIVVADDHPIMLKGIVEELSKINYTILETANNGAKALEIIVSLKPDIAILDIEMPLLNAYEIVERTRIAGVETKFVFMTYHKEKGYFLQAKNLNIDGYLLKEDGVEEIDLCIKTISDGEFYYSSSLDININEVIDEELKAINLLSPSERSIIRLVAQGKTSQEISEFLLISIRTVQKHRSNIVAKLKLGQGLDPLSKWILEHQEIIKSL